jgi:3-dehydroquinate dehydratase/shikimate dehydrogenase
MGPFGLPSRILSAFFNSYLMYVSPSEMLKNTAEVGHIDPITLDEVYHFHRIGAATKIFGVTGYPLTQTRSPEIHNAGYARHRMNSVYIPIRAATIEEALEFADTLGIRGLSVTIPHKESVLKYLSVKSDVVQKIGACNTLVRTPDGWHGDNTDAKGLELALLDFLRVKDFSGMRIAIIGAGGAAKAAAYAVKKLKGKACVFNRTIAKAKLLAEQYDFEWSKLDEESFSLLEKYSDLIIQTTAKGMGAKGAPDRDNDPLYFYNFSGKEALYDIIYMPEVTPVMARAAQAGCRTAGGFSMLQHQGYEQFLLFTGEAYD